MTRKSFLITYPDGTKKHINAAEREQMLFRGELRQVSGNRYEYTGIHVSKSFRTKDFSGLSVLLPVQVEKVRRNLGLEVVFKHGDRREWQSEETPEGFEARLQAMGMPATGFSEALV